MRRWGIALICAGVMPVLLGGAMFGYPRVGGYTFLAAFDHRPVEAVTFTNEQGIEFTATTAEIYNRGSTRQAGVATFISARNTRKTPLCFKISFRDEAQGQPEGTDRVWLIRKKQALRYIASSNTVDVWSCHDTYCSVAITDFHAEVWEPVASGTCG